VLDSMEGLDSIIGGLESMVGLVIESKGLDSIIRL
jgi:hypothetical protein